MLIPYLKQLENNILLNIFYGIFLNLKKYRKKNIVRSGIRARAGSPEIQRTEYQRSDLEYFELILRDLHQMVTGLRDPLGQLLSIRGFVP